MTFINSVRSSGIIIDWYIVKVVTHCHCENDKGENVFMCLFFLQWTSGWCFRTPTLTTSSALRSVTPPPASFAPMRGSGQRQLGSSCNSPHTSSFALEAGPTARKCPLKNLIIWSYAAMGRWKSFHFFTLHWTAMHSTYTRWIWNSKRSLHI